MKTWYIIGILVLIALALWFVFGTQKAVVPQTSALQEKQEASLTAGDTTADISADLNQTADTSAALDADAAASAQAVQGL